MSYMEKIQKLTTTCGDCWIWTKGCNGNGMPKFFHKMVRREMYLEQRGPIKDGKVVSTSCKTPKCVNPEHLILRTRSEIAKEVSARPSVISRKSFKSARTNQAARGKITMEIAEEIRNRTEMNIELAKIYNISEQLVSKVRLYKAWKPTGNPFAGLMR